MLGSHCRFLSIDSESYRPMEECRHVPTKEPRVNKVDDSLVDEVENALLLVDFVHRSIEFHFPQSFSIVLNIQEQINVSSVFFHVSSSRYSVKIVFPI